MQLASVYNFKIKAFLKQLTKTPNFKDVVTAVVKVVTFLITVADRVTKIIKSLNTTVSD